MSNRDMSTTAMLVDEEEDMTEDGQRTGDEGIDARTMSEPVSERSIMMSPGSNSHQAGSSSPGSVTGGPNGSSPGSNHPTFRRQRAARACETCHARKVRCDAASLGVPCTNCVAFSIECKIPPPKRKKTTPSKSKDDEVPEEQSTMSSHSSSQIIQSAEGTPSTTLTEAQNAQMAADAKTYTTYLKPQFARAPITEAGRVAYLGESSNLNLLVADKHGTTDVVHYPLPENVRGGKARLSDFDQEEIDILNRRGAFLLPPRGLCDELVEAYFKHIAPVVPVINRSRFMRAYKDPSSPPSLLLLQAILLAGSRVCSNASLLDANGSSTGASMTFYKRAKALYDAGYEDDRITIVQALILMGWYWEGPEDVTKNVFYWSRVAIIVAQGSGMHRSVERSQLSKADKRLWKRIWWTLFTRDRSVAVALGRPVHINTDDSDIEMVCEDDFIEDEPGYPAEYPAKMIHVQFFLHYVKLCEIMGLVLSQQYSVAHKYKRTNAMNLTHSDMALADWMINIPEQMRYHMNDESRQNFWAALLHATYYTTLCLLHRAHLPPANARRDESQADGIPSYPSRNIAFTAAANITSIIKNLISSNELKYCPAFVVYSLFSALIMLVYQLRSSQPSVVAITQERMKICMAALKEVSKVWLVAKMVHTLFESILNNKAMEERLQKASGLKRAMARAREQSLRQTPESAIKRKFDEMDIAGLRGGMPIQDAIKAQTSSLEPSAMSDIQNTNTMGAPLPGQAIPGQSALSRQGNQDTFMGGTTSKSNTRPTTPFQPSFSMPGTPPDLFLVTRNSPPISQSIWENFQPTQLFPEDSGIINGPSGFSPQQQGLTLNNMNSLDPQIAANFQQQQQTFAPHAMNQMQPPTHPTLGAVAMDTPNTNAMNLAPNPVGNVWSQFDFGEAVTGGSPEDTWSNSSASQGVPPAPATLNVEDWFNFFGISGMDGFNAAMANNNNNMGNMGANGV